MTESYAALKKRVDLRVVARRRHQLNQQARRNYRRKHPDRGYADWRVPQDALKAINSLGHRRWVIDITGESFLIQCLDKNELAKAMGRSLSLMQRWIRHGAFPKARTTARVGKRTKVEVYLISQVKLILTAYVAHLRDFADHYRADHLALRTAFFSAMAGSVDRDE